MTDAEREAVLADIRQLADRMGLRDWRFKVALHPVGEGAEAGLQFTDGRRRATIALSEEWFGQTPEEQRLHAVHELVHVHVEPCCVVLTNIRDALGESAYSVVKGAMGDAVEITVDSLAEVIAPSMPLPENASKHEPSRGPTRFDVHGLTTDSLSRHL